MFGMAEGGRLMKTLEYATRYWDAICFDNLAPGERSSTRLTIDAHEWEAMGSPQCIVVAFKPASEGGAMEKEKGI